MEKNKPTQEVKRKSLKEEMEEGIASEIYQPVVCLSWSRQNSEEDPYWNIVLNYYDVNMKHKWRAFYITEHNVEKSSTPLSTYNEQEDNVLRKKYPEYYDLLSEHLPPRIGERRLVKGTTYYFNKKKCIDKFPESFKTAFE